MNDEGAEQNNYAEKLARTMVWSGFYSRDRAIESVWENCFDIGKRICEKLRDEKLNFEWNETVDERIHLDKIVWRRCFRQV